MHVDTIILCTGYLYNFPFLADNLRLNPHDDPCQPRNKIWLSGLYRGIFWMPNPRLIYIGPHSGFFTFNLFDAQAWLCRDYILGDYVLPSKEEQGLYDRQMCDKCNGLEVDDLDVSPDPSKGETGIGSSRGQEGGTGQYDHRCIDFQGEYLKDLMALTDYPSFDVEQVKARFFEWESHKGEGIMTFRNNSYKSVMTGNLAPLLLDKDGHTVEWKDAMAETCESFGMHDLFDGNVRIVN
jgi:trimethylamine monooxygenase